MILEPARKYALTSFTQQVEGKSKAILMENITDDFIVVPEHYKLSSKIDHNAEAMTTVEEMGVHNLAQVPSKRQGS